MAIYSLLYVSDSRLGIPSDESQVESIVAVSQERNAHLQVTGALMFAYTHFAQVLEGPLASVDALMTSIKRDSRHTNVRVLETEQIVTRRFESWAMAYVGPPILVEERLAPLLVEDWQRRNPEATQELITLMRSLVGLTN